MSNTCNICLLQINLKHLKCRFFQMGSTLSFDKVLSVKDPLFLLIKKHQKHQMCVMNFVSHRGMHLKCRFFQMGSTLSFDKVSSVKDPLFLLIKKLQKHQMCVMNFVSHRGMAFILIGRSVIQQFCFLTLICMMTYKLCYLRNASVTKTLLSNNVA